MKTKMILYKKTSKGKVILYTLLLSMVMSCSKKDDPVAVVESVDEETALSSDKQITSFVFLLTDNPIDVSVVGTIDEENKTITAIMPPDTDITGLLPEVELSSNATLNTSAAQNFTEPLRYTVTAEDGSSIVYTVTVQVLLTQRQILQAILDANPENTLPWDLENTPELNSLDGVSTNVSGNIINLTIAARNLTQLPSEIGQLVDLKELTITANPLSSIPAEISELRKLEFLNISSNQIETLPIEIGQLTNLKELYFSNNRISKLPKEIRQLSNLIILFFSDNQINELPSEIEGLKSLVTLFGDNNRLTTLPPEIGNLESLRELFLSNNQLTTLPPEIGQLTALEQLVLQNNKISFIPPELGFLKNLGNLNLFNNNLTNIPQAICNLKTFHRPGMDFFLDDTVTCSVSTQLEALIGIYSANRNNTLDWGVNNYPEVTFNAEGHPTVITMNNKNLSRIPDDIGQLTALETLNANGNKLESLPNTLGNISSLSVINVDGNQLNTVPSQLGQLNNLALLTLTSNPITSIPQEVCDLQISNGGVLTILTDAGEGCN